MLDWVVLPLIFHIVLLGAILFLQKRVLPLVVTGTLVNSIFVVSLLTHHDFWSYCLAVFAPVLSLFTGHLSAELNPLIPFISLGNVVLIFMYSHIADSDTLPPEPDLLKRVIAPSFTKAFLISSGGFMLLMHGDLKDFSKKRLVFIMAIQFLTSVAGVLMGEKIARDYLL